MPTRFEPAEPARADIDASLGLQIVEFGSPGCGWCRSAQPMIESALAEHPQVRHLKIADGPGQPLGRSFGVKLWPTLVLLRDGVERARLVRPGDAGEVRAALDQIVA